MIDPITLRHGYKHIPNTCQSGSQRIDHCLCTNQINNFITKCAITPFNFFSSSDHRSSYLDIQLKRFLLDSFTLVILSSSRLLTTKKIDYVRIYKTRLLKYITTNNILSSTKQNSKKK